MHYGHFVTELTAILIKLREGINNGRRACHDPAQVRVYPGSTRASE